MTTSTGPAVAVSAAPAAGTSARRFLMAVGGGVAILDQATKALVRATLALHDSVTVVPGLVDLTHVRNTGAAFGLLNAADFPFKPLVMLGIAVAAFLAIAVFALQLPPEDRLARTGLGLVLGGAVGNLIDRATVGYVLDFVDVYWRTYHFWAFNVADAAITVGAGLVLVELVGLRRRPSPSS